MGEAARITEYLEIDLEREMWRCARCHTDLAGARRNYKEGLLIAERSPHEVHPPRVEGEYTFSPDPGFCVIVEFYCPGCLVMVETEYLPPGHPLTHDIELDIDALKQRYQASGEPGR